MKKFFLPLLAVGLWSTPALAETYVSGSVGLGSLGNADAISPVGTARGTVEFKSGVPFGVAAGLKSNEYRAEAAIGYQSNTINKVSGATVTGSDVSSLSLMLNGYRDFIIDGSSLSPYVTAGVGMAKIKAKVSGTTVIDQSGVFAWQLGGGVGLQASKNITVDLGYRYFKPSNASYISLPIEVTSSDSQFLVGARYSF